MKFLVPEAIQSSAMDCGPAALKALLEGHGIPASYGRLREACQTGIDGTSIDQIEIAARELGLDAEQIMLPVDHVLLEESEALPAIVVTRQPSGYTHFVVVWRVVGDWVQLMDPGTGRRWMRKKAFLAEVHRHSQSVPANAWREFSIGDAFLNPLRRRMRSIGADESLIGRVEIARLDAAIRMVQSFVDSGAVRGDAGKLLAGIAMGNYAIPDPYWCVRPESTETAVLTGAVLLRVRGKRAGEIAPASRELAAAIAEKPATPLRDLLKIVGYAGMPAIVLALFTAAAGITIEALLFRSFFDLDHDLTVRGQRIGALTALFAITGIVLAMEFSATKGALRIGRRLENIIRLRFLEKLPKLGDRYFQSRPASDMAMRSHQVYLLRKAPQLSASLLRVSFEMFFTLAGIAWLYPSAVVPAALLVVLCIGIPLAFQPALNERDLRMRSHSGALSQFNLDALLGLTAIRAHGADRAIRRQQEASLASWARAAFSLQRLATAAEAIQTCAAFAVGAWIVWNKLSSEPAGMLLLAYWILNLPSLGQEAATAALQYPALRNTAIRLMEPLNAPEEPEAQHPNMSNRSAVEIELDNVTVRAAGNLILDEVSVRITAGSHVAIVGASGAGKSSLAGLLLGWHRAESGSVRIDGRELDAAMLAWLRSQTAWIDPQVQIWNRSMLENLSYGAAPGLAMNRNLEDANLYSVIEKMPHGLQQNLGEGGAMVSGGEGQRVRIGRALGRENARLVILDEPTRGLDADRRRAVLECARERWRQSTLIAITHDLRDTLDFDRVLVVDGGRVVEDGIPRELAANPDSKYRRLIDVEDELKRGLWASRKWRRMAIRDGNLIEEAKRGIHATAR